LLASLHIDSNQSKPVNQNQPLPTHAALLSIPQDGVLKVTIVDFPCDPLHREVKLAAALESHTSSRWNPVRLLTLRMKLGCVPQSHVLPLHHESNGHIIWLLRSRAFVDQTLPCKLDGCIMIHAVPSTAHCKRPYVFAFHVLWSTSSDPQWFCWLPGNSSIGLRIFLQQVFH
jgi:hypothetical protein